MTDTDEKRFWIPIQDRVAYYLGGTEKLIDELPGDKSLFLTKEDLLNSTSKLAQAYRNSIFRLLSYSSLDGHWFKTGDMPFRGGRLPVVVKIRDAEDDRSNGIIFNLKEQRHFPNLMEILPLDIDWRDKKNEVIWRGGFSSPARKIGRREFVSQFEDKFDVGFVVSDKNDKPQKISNPKERMSIPEMLKYKYLPVLDGNDKSTSLIWVLASGSVPIMAKPRYHSWACEPWLQPGVHYCEMKPDFSNFADQIEYLKSHDDHAREIAENGWAFASQFYDLRRELEVERELVRQLDALCS